MTGIVMIIFGAYFTLIGLGKVAVSKKAEKNTEWLNKYGMFLKIAGPIMVVCGGILLFLK
ncbi:MAG: hypothetical protein H8E53_05300 [Planctomycetes bacterium]|nr:hypothetical protein [Planctomycetota bacterium]